MGARVHEAHELRVGIVGCGRMGCAIAGACFFARFAASVFWARVPCARWPELV